MSLPQYRLPGKKTRSFHLVPIGLKRTFLNLSITRMVCRRCGAIRWPSLPFAHPKKHYVHGFAQFALELLKLTTIEGAARLLGVSWDLIKDIHKTWLQKRYRRLPFKEVRYLGIDEFSIKKGHSYLTIAVDLESGRILYSAEGKSSETLRPLIEKLKRQAPHLKAIALDMNWGYLSALSQQLPQVDLVYDHYHISALFNHELDRLRRGLQQELDALGEKTLKGSRYLLLSNYQNLSSDKQTRLKRLLQANTPLTTMYLMKEQFQEFWRLERPEDAAQFLDKWCEDASNSGIQPLMKMARTFMAQRLRLLNYFRHRISTGKVEGINNKIKTLKRQAYGFRDLEYFQLRLFHLHEQFYSFAG